VALTAREAVIEARMTAASRHHTRKLVDVDLYRRLRESGTFLTPVLPSPRLTLDVERLSPAAAAERIAALCG